MQTSNLTPVTLYSSLADEANLLLPTLPDGSKAIDKLENIPNNRLTILITHDQTSARTASQWVESQPQHRHNQIFLILPEGKSRLDPDCVYKHRPMHLNDILHFIKSSRALPELPSSLKLTEIETNLIEQLHVSGKAVEHKTIMQKIWGHNNELDTHTLETHLYRLRKKLENSQLEIITENGTYKLLSSDK